MRVLHVSRGFRPFSINGLLEYAEDLMDIQVSQGYQVAYFFSGRHYPLLRSPRLIKRSRKDIRMYEILNSLIVRGHGTMYPDVDLNEEESEKFFLETLSEFKPDIVHIQDLYGLPSSLIDIVKLKNIPILMTLHDYFLLCPTSKLFDYNHSLCSSHYVGDKCVLCCAQAPHSATNSLYKTLTFEIKRWLPKHLENTIASNKKAIKNFLKSFRNSFKIGSYTRGRRNELELDYFKKNDSLEEVFQSRRDTNLERLNKIELLVSVSFKTAKIYQNMGVKADKIKIVHASPKHIDYIKHKHIISVDLPISFVTLNSFSSIEKGAYLLLKVLRKLDKLGLINQFRLFVMGSMLDDIKDELLQFDNVVYKGTYNATDLDSLLEGMHVGIVPSVWEEVYGYVGIEFLAKGIPVIGNSLGGIVDYTIDRVTGWVNRENTADGLAQIMTDIIYNPKQILDLNRSILLNHHQIVKSMDKHFEEMDNIYKGLIKAQQNQESGVIELGH